MSYEVDGKKYLNERAIATQQTGFWFVGECRAWMPKEIGGIFWFGVDDAGTSPLTPVYTSSRSISSHYALGNGSMIKYSETSMFWMVNRIAQFAYLRYNHIGAEVRSIIDKHENTMFAEVAETDKKAKEMLTRNSGNSGSVGDFLTNFSVGKANDLFEMWKNLDRYLLVKFIDGNTKKQNQDGSFVNNGFSPDIPPAPEFPGYSERWKKAVKVESGSRLTL